MLGVAVGPLGPQKAGGRVQQAGVEGRAPARARRLGGSSVQVLGLPDVAGGLVGDGCQG